MPILNVYFVKYECLEIANCNQKCEIRQILENKVECRFVNFQHSALTPRIPPDAYHSFIEQPQKQLEIMVWYFISVLRRQYTIV